MTASACTFPVSGEFRVDTTQLLRRRELDLAFDVGPVANVEAETRQICSQQRSNSHRDPARKFGVHADWLILFGVDERLARPGYVVLAGGPEADTVRLACRGP